MFNDEQLNKSLKKLFEIKLKNDIEVIFKNEKKSYIACKTLSKTIKYDKLGECVCEYRYKTCPKSSEASAVYTILRMLGLYKGTEKDFISELAKSDSDEN